MIIKTEGDKNKLKSRKMNKSTADMKIKNKQVLDESENEEEENEEEENEEEEGGEEDEGKEESEVEEGNKSKRKGKSKFKNKTKGERLNKSVVLRNKKKLDNKIKGKNRINKSVILKKKNILDKNKKRPTKLDNKIKQKKRSQSVKTRKPFKTNNKMQRTNRSAKVGLPKRNKKNDLGRTNRSAQNIFKKKQKNFDIKKRSRTPNVSKYRNKFWKNDNKKLKNNRFSKTDINIRPIKLNNKYSTHTSFNNNIRNNLRTEGNKDLKKNYFNQFQQSKRDKRLKPINTNTNKFMQNTQNFFNPTQRNFNTFRKNFDIYDKEREQGFFNRITLYPNYNENDEIKSIKGDNLNPYSTNWPSSFLKIGYSSGFYYEDYQDGVPILRLKKIRNKIILPPIQNSRYSQISEKIEERPNINFNYMSRQERINYILNTENNSNKNDAFRSVDARRKLLDKFNIKGFDLPKENEEGDEEDEEENEDEEEDEENKEEDDEEDNEKKDENDDNKNEEEDEGSSSHPNEIE